jgi:fucose 4-O-acetylase-like acetyltransferase
MTTRPDIEALRTISIFGIVWYHAYAPGHDIAYAGLIGFLILSMYLAGSQPITLAASVRKRFTRLLVPWLIWSVIYGMANVRHGQPPIAFDNGILAGILVSSSIHLWYLPYVSLALVSFDRIKARISGQHLAMASAALCILALALVPYWRPASMGWGQPWLQYAHALPGLLLGVFFLHYKALPGHVGKGLAVVLFMLACARAPYEGVGVPYAIGIGAGYAIAHQTFAQKTPAFLSAPGRYALGIYVIHILPLAVAQQLKFLPVWAHPVFAFAVSLAAIAAFWKACPRVARYAC